MKWRVLLRDYLAARAGEVINFGDMVRELTPHVPRYEAERFWHKEHKGSDEVVAPNRKIARLICHELPDYPTEIIGRDHGKGLQWTFNTMFRPLTRACVICGTPYVARRRTLTCSRTCSGKRATLVRMEHAYGDRKQEEPTMAPARHPEITTIRHPEITAIEMIYDALRSLPDEPARQRVLTYVRHLIETSDTPRLQIIDASNAAD